MATLEKDVRAFAAKAKLNTRTAMRAAALEICTSIILKTPVGDPNLWVTKNTDGVYVDYIAYRGYPQGYTGGRARNNWIATLDRRATHTRATPDESGQKAIGQMQAKLADFGGNVFFLTNNLPYIRRLEYEGWSTQAPAGMLRISALEYQDAIRRKAATLS